MPRLLNRRSPELGLFVVVVVIGGGVLIGVLAVGAELVRAFGF
jgi:hypothetical protein